MEIPKGKYNGQKLTKLVSTKIVANTNNTIANVPEIIPIKYNPNTIAAAKILTALSDVPIFAFILFVLKFLCKIRKTKRKYRQHLLHKSDFIPA